MFFRVAQVLGVLKIGEGFAIQSVFMVDDPQCFCKIGGEVGYGLGNCCSDKSTRLHYKSAQCMFLSFFTSLKIFFSCFGEIFRVKERKSGDKEMITEKT